ncbi:transferase family protein [Aspergillus avenaceus]|uniref:Transferase family protein n=1 Tax=Aspergillus avenaceus TaxID=36643 RepID=A0A5N6TT90_ASPAV|nr:transferase family protein [Aspergillus avenaceus]
MEKARIHPSVRPTTTTSTPLSIFDATVARYTPTGAIWLFDQVPSDISETDFLDRLRSSYANTLNDFPQWAGQLQWGPVRKDGTHTERFNRPIIVYGAETDPGVEWGVARHPSLKVKELTPSASERSSGSGAWIADGFDQTPLVSNTLLPLYNLRDYEGLPAVQVQVNLFSDGGYAISIKIAHVLADAQTLMVFMHNWAANSRKLFHAHNTSSLMGHPVFDPAQLDAHAAGDIDAPTPDPEIITKARQLPIHRFDWWKSDAPGYPAPLIPTTENSKPPASELAQVNLSPSDSPPWHTVDFSKPAKYTLLHYTNTEINKLKQSAQKEGHATISKLDVLLAHLWSTINRARGHTHTPSNVVLNYTMGARARVYPPLPPSFLGSPLFITNIQMPGTTLCSTSVGDIAAKIRHTVQLFTPDVVGAVLHDAAHEVSPQRLWQGFFGNDHTLLTSWLRIGVYDVDFVGSGDRPRYVHAYMPKVDGCLQVMESGDGSGIDVALYLEGEAMKRLLVDPKLRI